MKRLASTCTVIFGLAVLSSPALAQSKAAQTKPAQASAAKAAPAANAAPAAPAKFVKTMKGVATVDFIEGPSKKVGNEIVTVLKVKNTSPLAISLFKVDEYWYNKKQQVVTGDSVPYRKPFLAGEIIEITLKAPVKPDLYQNQYQFSHAGGDIKLTRVKKFE
jgi:methionine-rich copper-binding protein CopC